MPNIENMMRNTKKIILKIILNNNKKNNNKTLEKDILSLGECERCCRTESKKLMDEKDEMQKERNQLLMHQFVIEARQVYIDKWRRRRRGRSSLYFA
jgi:hypothetical protein